MAETFEVNCAPHNYYSHLATLIAAQWCAAIPNARILEFDVDDVPWRDELRADGRPRTATGQSTSRRPGLGRTVDEDVARAPLARVRQRMAAHDRWSDRDPVLRDGPRTEFLGRASPRRPSTAGGLEFVLPSPFLARVLLAELLDEDRRESRRDRDRQPRQRSHRTSTADPAPALVLQVPVLPGRLPERDNVVAAPAPYATTTWPTLSATPHAPTQALVQARRVRPLRWTRRHRRATNAR